MAPNTLITEVNDYCGGAGPSVRPLVETPLVRLEPKPKSQEELEEDLRRQQANKDAEPAQ